MPKADRHSNSPRVPLQAALKLALAEQRLLAAMAQATPADWRCGYAEHCSDVTDFWQRPSDLVVNWEASSAYRREMAPSGVVGFVRGATLYGIEIRRAYLEECFGLLPITDKWIIAEVKAILKNGGPSTGRPLADEVRRGMIRASKANPNIKPLSAGTIRNKIIEFDLLPDK
jgi:hypothetical protein